MHSKNKRPMDQQERAHVERIKELPCCICGHHAPSEAHEIRQGDWFTCIPLCEDCHRGSFNGIHGQKRIWSATKMDEMAALNKTIRRILNEPT